MFRFSINKSLFFSIGLVLIGTFFIQDDYKNHKDREMASFHVYFYSTEIHIHSFYNRPKVLDVKGFNFLPVNGVNRFIDFSFKLKKGFHTFVLTNELVAYKKLEESKIFFSLDSNIHQKVEVFDYREKKTFRSSETISEDIAVFKNICPFNNLKLKKYNKIKLVNSCIILNGEKDFQYIRYLSEKYIYADKDSSVTVMNFQNPVHISNLILEGGGTRWVDGLFLSGSLNVYNNKKFTLKNIKVGGALGEDGIHIKDSFGEISDSIVLNSYLDAIDIDLSEVVINKLMINNAGGDGVDFSKTKAVIQSSNFHNIVDKAISVGESSDVKASSLSFKEPIGIWVASKDSSVFVYKGEPNNKIINFQKKDFWDNGRIIYE